MFVLPREGGSLISIKYIIIDSEGKEGEESDTADKQSDIQEGHINFYCLFLFKVQKETMIVNRLLEIQMVRLIS